MTDHGAASMIPKRAVGALLTTAVALVLLLSFKTPEAPALAATTATDSAVVGQPAATDAPAATEAPAAGAGQPAAGAAYVDGTVTGPVVSTRFGDVQVQVTIAGGAITDVTALQLPSDDRHSRQISDAAEPILRSAALTAQSAEIDLLSGATYTSGAYVESLQAALDQAAA